MKKILTVLAAMMVTVAAFAGSVSAATENDVITALENANVPDAYVSTAESYMASHDLTAAQIDAVIADINAAGAITGGTTKFQSLTSEQKEQIVAKVTDAATVLGLKTTYSSSKDLSIIDSTGKALLVVNINGAVKKTGFDYTIAFVGLGLIAAAGVSAVVIRTVSGKKITAAEA